MLSRFLIIFLSFTINSSCIDSEPEWGSSIDQFNDIAVYYNGKNMNFVAGRNLSSDGYNLGLKYQCVEFVKRYYYEFYNHRMPNTYGHAKSFFDHSLQDQAFNKQRNLMQFRNARESKPKAGDILVYDQSDGNPFGHVAIISQVEDDFIEIIQQNMGLKSRVKIPLINYYKYWTIADYSVLGWLRLKN